MRAEAELVKAASKSLGIVLRPQRLEFDGGGVVEVDGCNVEFRVVCEAFARIGRLKSGQRQKLGNDILKMLLVERRMGGHWRKVLLLAGEDCRRLLSGQSWQAQAVRDFGIELCQIELGHQLYAEVVLAQGRQVMTNREADTGA